MSRFSRALQSVDAQQREEDAQTRLAAAIDAQRTSDSMLPPFGHKEGWDTDDLAHAAAARDGNDFDDGNITEGIVAAVDAGVPAVQEPAQPSAVAISRVDEARAHFTERTNQLIERKSETERRMAEISKARLEREQAASAVYNAEMAQAAADFDQAMFVENTNLREFTALKEAFDLALARLNKG